MSEAARERRLVKPPISYVIPKICYPRKRKRKPKKKLPEECNYQLIPCPLKFIYTCNIYRIYGDINLREHEGTLITDTTLLNHRLSCKDIQIIDGQDHKMVQLTLDINFQFQLPPWQLVTAKLRESESTELVRWANIIENYTLRYENMLRSFSNREANLNGEEEERLKIVDFESRKKLQKFFKKYACINFKTKFKNNNMHVTEICLNDKYLNELGYSIDSFTLTVLREGVPHLVPVNNTHTVQALMENYHNVENSSEYKTAEFNSSLTVKNGYSRRIKYKVYYLPTFEDGFIGYDCFVPITGKESPTYLSSENPSYCSLNKQFLDQMLTQEKESDGFLKKFYNTSIQQKYTTMDKVCKVKELKFIKQEDEDI